jgi:CheY-like chemotaxis protein
MPAMPPGQSGPCTVLVAEDDAFTAMMLFHSLTGRGFQVCGLAHTAADALDMAQRHRPDVAVLDIRLSAGDGLELGRQLQGRYGTRLIFASAFAQASQLQMPAGSLFLTKPYDGDVLARAVALLARPEADSALPPGVARAQPAA